MGAAASSIDTRPAGALGANGGGERACLRVHEGDVGLKVLGVPGKGLERGFARPGGLPLARAARARRCAPRPAHPAAAPLCLPPLAQEPEQYCSAGTAAELAAAAYRRAAALSQFGSSVVGVGATCSLATVRAGR
jgi:hypothetical protein